MYAHGVPAGKAYNSHVVSQEIQQWLSAFGLDGWIRDQIAIVVENLPHEVQIDLMKDPAFFMCDYDPTPRRALHVPMKLQGRGKPARSVVLKRTIKRRPMPFARWVIAHELAHAFLRHGGRWPDEDPEHAADSLASSWGFPKPTEPM